MILQRVAQHHEVDYDWQALNLHVAPNCTSLNVFIIMKSSILPTSLEAMLFDLHSRDISDECAGALTSLM